jgi:hypothetical protein
MAYTAIPPGPPVISIPPTSPQKGGDATTANILQQLADALFAKLQAGLVGHPWELAVVAAFKIVVDGMLQSLTPSIAQFQILMDQLFTSLEFWASFNPTLKTWLTTVQAWLDGWFINNGGRETVVTKAA